MKMTNRGNQIIYKYWAPIYDPIAGRLYQAGRRRAYELVNPKPGEKLLIVGVGTGADFPLIPEGVEATGIDLSEDMLARAKEKAHKNQQRIEFILGDAQTLLVPESSQDILVFNLILAVIPDGRLCLEENWRALKPGGRAVIFDKFLPDEGEITFFRRLINQVATLIGTDVNRKFKDILGNTPARVVVDEPCFLGGAYRVILLEKPG